MANAARTHRLGLYLKSKDRRLPRNIANKSVITNSKQLKQKSAAFYKTTMATEVGISWRLVYRVLQIWKNYENFRILPSMQTGRQSSLRRRTPFWKYQAEYKNCKMKWIVWSIPRVVRMLHRFAVEIPTLLVNQRYSYFIPNMTGCYLSERRDSKKGRQVFGYTGYIRKRFCSSTCFFLSTLSSRIESMEFVCWGTAQCDHSRERWKTRTKSRSEMPVRTVSQRFSTLWWRRLYKEFSGRPTTTADFGS